jgi:hypothetical protein
MKPLRNLFLGSLAVIVVSQAANAAGDTWKTAAASGNWYNVNHWSGGSTPNAATDIAPFSSGDNFTTVSIGSTATTLAAVRFSGAGVGGFAFTAVPEPTGALAGLLLSAGLWRRRRG